MVSSYRENLRSPRKPLMGKTVLYKIYFAWCQIKAALHSDRTCMKHVHLEAHFTGILCTWKRCHTAALDKRQRDLSWYNDLQWVPTRSFPWKDGALAMVTRIYLMHSSLVFLFNFWKSMQFSWQALRMGHLLSWFGLPVSKGWMFLKSLGWKGWQGL